jgi:hypothetical protein
MSVVSKRSLFRPVVALLAILLTAGMVTADEINIDAKGDLTGGRKTAVITVSIECTTAGTPTLRAAYIFQSLGRLLNIGTLTSFNPNPIPCTGSNTVDTFTVDIDAMDGTQFQSGPASVLLQIEFPGTPTNLVEKAGKVNLHKD